MNVIAVDPGREKCGLAVMRNDGFLFYKDVLATSDLPETVKHLQETYAAGSLVIGNGTTSKSAQAAIRALLPALKLIVVDEFRTTDTARLRYWQENPPRSWRRLLPTSLQVPPVPVDDYVAVILAERYLEHEKRSRQDEKQAKRDI